jgi:plasmid stabilization system protein ParE
MRVRYTPRAFADREAIYKYLEKRSPQGARNVKIAIVHAIRSLASHPRLGRLTDRTDVYELIVPRPSTPSTHAGAIFRTRCSRHPIVSM